MTLSARIALRPRRIAAILFAMQPPPLRGAASPVSRKKAASP